MLELSWPVILTYKQVLCFDTVTKVSRIHILIWADF